MKNKKTKAGSLKQVKIRDLKSKKDVKGGAPNTDIKFTDITVTKHIDSTSPK